MIYGPRGIGKTYLSISLACSLASGTPFLKWNSSSKSGVLYVDGEMLRAEMQKRFKSIMPNSPENLYLLSSEEVYDQHEFDLSLTKKDMRDEISNLVSLHPEIKVIIIDNISCLFMGIDENKKADWEQIIPWLIQFRRRGIALSLIHHAGKSGDQRGTSRREDILDTIIKLEEAFNAKNDVANFIIRFTKNKGAFGDVVEPIEVHLDLDSEDKWEWKPYEETLLERVISFVENGIDSVTAISKELDVTAGRVSQIKSRGIEKGVFEDRRKFVLTMNYKEKM